MPRSAVVGWLSVLGGAACVHRLRERSPPARMLPRPPSSGIAAAQRACPPGAAHEMHALVVEWCQVHPQPQLGCDAAVPCGVLSGRLPPAMAASRAAHVHAAPGCSRCFCGAALSSAAGARARSSPAAAAASRRRRCPPPPCSAAQVRGHAVLHPDVPDVQLAMRWQAWLHWRSGSTCCTPDSAGGALRCFAQASSGLPWTLRWMRAPIGVQGCHRRARGEPAGVYSMSRVPRLPRPLW